MLDKLTRKLTEKMGKSVKETIKPIVDETSKKVDNKIDLYSRILKFGVLVILFIEGTKKAANDYSDSKSGPSQIVINNYLGERKDGDG